MFQVEEPRITICGQGLCDVRDTGGAFQRLAGGLRNGTYYRCLLLLAVAHYNHLLELSVVLLEHDVQCLTNSSLHLLGNHTYV